MKTIKRIIAFLVVIVFLCSIISTPVNAIGPSGRRFSAWLLSLLTAYNITLSSTIAPYSELLDFISDPLGLEYTYPSLDWEKEILDKSSIIISDDVVTIDGVDYRNVWLSTDAANKFRVNALDFATAYNMTSNTQGTFVSGNGYFDGIPLYQDNNSHVFSQVFNVGIPEIGQDINYNLGNGLVTSNRPNSASSVRVKYVNSLGNTYGYLATNVYPGGSATPGCQFYGNINGQSINNFKYWSCNNGTRINSSSVSQVNLYEYDPFDFDWVAGQVDLDPIIPDDYGLWTRIPDQTIQDSHDIYPDVDISNPITFDFDLPDIGDKLGLLFDILDILMDLLEDDPQVVQPVIGPKDEEPIPPTPGEDTIGNTPWQSLVQEISRIIQAIQNIPNTFQNLFNSIISAIQSLQQSIVNKLDSILQSITDIADKIETGVTDLFKDFLTGLENIFRPILLRIAQALTIWHYVVEWIASIGTVFAWIWSILSGASYYISLPVYACIAAAICLAFYKRFGR